MKAMLMDFEEESNDAFDNKRPDLQFVKRLKVRERSTDKLNGTLTSNQKNDERVKKRQLDYQNTTKQSTPMRF